MMFWSKVHELDTDDVKQKTSLVFFVFMLRKKCAWYYFMVVLLFLICHLCPVHQVSADVLFLPVQLSLLHVPVNLFKNALFF